MMQPQYTLRDGKQSTEDKHPNSMQTRKLTLSNASTLLKPQANCITSACTSRLVIVLPAFRYSPPMWVSRGNQAQVTLHLTRIPIPCSTAMLAQCPDLLKYNGPVTICYDVRALVRCAVVGKLTAIVCKGFAPWKAETLLQAQKHATAEGEPRPRPHA